MAEFMIEVAEN